MITQSLQTHLHGGTVVSPILQMRKLRLTKVKQLPLGRGGLSPASPPAGQPGASSTLWVTPPSKQKQWCLSYTPLQSGPHPTQGWVVSHSDFTNLAFHPADHFLSRAGLLMSAFS